MGVKYFTVTAFVHRSHRHPPFYHFSNAVSLAPLRLEIAFLTFCHNMFSFCHLLRLFQRLFVLMHPNIIL